MCCRCCYFCVVVVICVDDVFVDGRVVACGADEVVVAVVSGVVMFDDIGSVEAVCGVVVCMYVDMSVVCCIM